MPQILHTTVYVNGITKTGHPIFPGTERSLNFIARFLKTPLLLYENVILLTGGCGSRVWLLFLGPLSGSSDLVSKNIMNSLFYHECRTPVLGNSHFNENWSAVIKQHQRKMKSLGIYSYYLKMIYFYTYISTLHNKHSNLSWLFKNSRKLLESIYCTKNKLSFNDKDPPSCPEQKKRNWFLF